MLGVLNPVPEAPDVEKFKDCNSSGSVEENSGEADQEQYFDAQGEACAELPHARHTAAHDQGTTDKAGQYHKRGESVQDASSGNTDGAGDSETEPDLYRLSIFLRNVRMFAATMPSLEDEHGSGRGAKADFGELAFAAVAAGGPVYKSPFDQGLAALVTGGLKTGLRDFAPLGSGTRNTLAAALELQRQERRRERVSALEWCAIFTGDLGIVKDSAGEALRPRILVCSPQPYRYDGNSGGIVDPPTGRAASATNSTSASSTEASPGPAAPTVTGRVRLHTAAAAAIPAQRLGCPHFDMSMAQYALALSVYYDNFQETAEFIEPRISGGSSAAAAVDWPDTAAGWGYWPEQFASEAFTRRLRGLVFSSEMCVFLPAVRIDCAMDTAYFPSSPGSAAAVLGAAGFDGFDVGDTNTQSAGVGVFPEGSAKAPAGATAIAPAEAESARSSIPAFNTGSAETTPAAVVPFLQIEATGLRVHMAFGGMDSTAKSTAQAAVVPEPERIPKASAETGTEAGTQAASARESLKLTTMLVTISANELDLIDCRMPSSSGSPSSRFIRGVFGDARPTPLERYLLRCRRPPQSSPGTGGLAPADRTAPATWATSVCPACNDPHRLLSCLWPCQIHGSNPCSTNSLTASAGTIPDGGPHLHSNFWEPWAVPVNHEFGLREGRQTVFAPSPPSSTADGSGACPRRMGCGVFESLLAPRPPRLPVECTMFFVPGQLDINLGMLVISCYCLLFFVFAIVINYHCME